MSVFLREGMCGWIRAWIHPGPDYGDRKAPKKNPALMDVSAETDNDSQALVGLIASMTLSKLKGG
jgi:hypothetical protein